MLANSVSVSCGIPMTIPYVAICATFDCISSMLTLIFLQKSRFWLITSSCSNKSFVDGWLVPPMADLITSNRVKLLMPLWSPPSAIWRMASVTLLSNNLVMALTTPSLAPMTD